MQAVRTSDRLRSRFSIVTYPVNARGSVSTPNLRNMGDDQHNQADNENVGHGVFLPDLGDLIPNEMGQGDGEDLFEEDSLDSDYFFQSIFRNGWIEGIALVLLIILSAFLTNLILSRRDVNSVQSRFHEYNCGTFKYSALKQTNMDKNIRFLKRKLRRVTKGVHELLEWRENMSTESIKMKNDTLSKCSKELEKFSMKIEEALTLYDADKMGMIDYALESAGGYITSILDTIPAPSQLSYTILGLLNIHYPSNPRLLIQPGTLPGQCFAFKGTHGKIRIELAHLVNITAVTIEHAHQNLVGDINSAPKNFKVYGLETANSQVGSELGAFTYSLDKSPLQTFYIQKYNEKGYKHVELYILTNQGNSEFTCIYRFRVHGNKIEVP